MCIVLCVLGTTTTVVVVVNLSEVAGTWHTARLRGVLSTISNPRVVPPRTLPYHTRTLFS